MNQAEQINTSGNTPFDLNSIISDAINMIKNPKGFFTNLKLDVPLTDSLVRAAIYGLAYGVIAFVLGLVGFGKTLGIMAGSIAGIFGIIMGPIFMILGLFIGALILLIISAICGGNTNYLSNLRVQAALLAFSPLYAVNMIFGGINFYLGTLVSLCLSLFYLYLCYIAMTHALKGKEMPAKITFIILAALSALTSFGSMAAYRTVGVALDSAGTKFEDFMDKNKGDIDRLQKNIGTLGDKFLDKMNEEMEKGIDKMDEGN